MTFEELQSQYRDLVRTISPDEYLFAEDRGEFDQLRVSRIRIRLILINLVLLLSIAMGMYAADVSVIGQSDKMILQQAKAVVPQASQWADDRATLLLQADSRVVALLHDLRTAPDVPVLDEWVSRFSNHAPPLTRVSREEALIQLAIRIARFDPAVRLAVIEHLLAIGVMLNDPPTLDAVRAFAELPDTVRNGLVEGAKLNRRLRDALQAARDDVDRMNNDLQRDVIEAERTRSLLERTWSAASTARQRCYALAQQTAACLGAGFAK